VVRYPAPAPGPRGGGAQPPTPPTPRAPPRLHLVVYVGITLLFVSGISLLGNGIPRIEALFGGHESTGRWHRWIGFALIALALLLSLVRTRSVWRFLRESVGFRAADIDWFLTYPRFVTRPARNAPARHDGHFDPGQRVFNCVIVIAFVVLSVTGLFMSFPDRFTPAVFAWSFRFHRWATWAIVVAVVGHVLIASGLLRAYRGVWRAMHGSGRVDAVLAERLWPAWAEQESGPDGS